MKNPIKSLIRSGVQSEFNQIHAESRRIRKEITDLKLLTGRMLANQVKAHGIFTNIQDAEFKVYSQFGDDGILQYLIHQTRPDQQTFIEFGVTDYNEANTRFLLMNDNWCGMVMDGSSSAIERLQSEWLHYWRYDLQAVCAFITTENINQLFQEKGFSGEIGFLSIDIDGNDYWVWEKIDSVNPVIVTVEYNSVFGMERAVTVPYDPAFNRTKAHYSNLYWGASLKALCLLAEKKGYAFVGCNSSGNNAHFVRKDKLGLIPSLSPEQGYAVSKFRESQDIQGKLTYIAGKQRLYEIKDMQVYDVEKATLVLLSDLIKE